jgi:hypothetical protein
MQLTKAIPLILLPSLRKKGYKSIVVEKKSFCGEKNYSMLNSMDIKG